MPGPPVELGDPSRVSPSPAFIPATSGVRQRDGCRLDPAVVIEPCPVGWCTTVSSGPDGSAERSRSPLRSRDAGLP
ncbi:hypothetical protein JOF56_009477 [Kibdelosporangium banguiense]|uniref:Uncharacterized protein n=1 Tax=Kibdelosporangium banguiense TaxID=1365924 RepID=A0ABS4TXI4_9PSEU|nr:hypothetical protein [Kibdelosporangium banguiense]MBP2329092.1 hypothetical protein [Kibdelosporangium banguiense]